MDWIQHKYVNVDGLKLHVVDIGTGSNAIVFLHGFPEIWYSWRHQMIVLADAGFRAISFDYRGYGLSDVPPTKATFSDVLNDLLAIIDSLGLPKDWANEIYKRVEDRKSSRGRNQDALLSACLYIACRQEGKPRTVKGTAYDSFNI